MSLNLTTETMLESDIIPILTIQSANLRDNLKPGQRQGGYLSIAFSENAFRALNRDIGVVVAKVQEQLVGYSCISSVKRNAQFPILDQIAANLSCYRIPGHDDRPAEATTCFHGPVCIAASFRGRDVLTRLFSYETKLAKKAGYSFCFSFISAKNQPSLKAHLKLPFHQVGKLAYQNSEYLVLACKI
jgi:hypothetical protein